ncbi:MAG: TIGR00282 family metallophosphoesterase [Deltaproteobacteria bacterium]|nr:TIGR00282 family metallophosphoesterase [Deltaproteobacteria bacterium]
MKILLIGDIFGEPGREAVRLGLPSLIAEHKIDFVIANCENAAHGRGVTPKIANDLLAQKINVLTSGNHIWDQKEIMPYIQENRRLLKPANYPPGSPGQGACIYNDYMGVRVGVINLEGLVHMTPKDCPFRTTDRILAEWQGQTDIVVVDMHAEATSEKRAIGWYLDGRVTAVIGTHTHVPTADEEILPGGTAVLTDVGMTGPYDSVIGLAKEVALKRFTSRIPEKFEVALGDPRLSAVLIDADERSGKARSIQRIQKKVA